MTTDALLPAEFADLEPFAREWVLPTSNERNQHRLESTMADMQVFYNAAVGRANDAMEYLDQFPIDDLPEQALHLFWLMCSLSTVSFAVDVFRQPKVPDSGDGILPFTVEPGP